MKRTVAAIRAAAKGPLPEEIRPDHCLVTDLGFDSMSMTLLALALEDAFEVPVLLDQWISEHTSPDALTVASLCAYLNEVLPDERATVRS